MKSKKVLLAGASGLVGGHLLNRLVLSNQVAEIHVPTRRPLGILQEKVREHLLDFDQLDRWSEPVDVVVCTLGTTIKKAGSKAAFKKVDHDYPLALGHIAKRMGAPFLLVSSIGAAAGSGSFYLHTKGALEQALTDLALPGLAVLRPSLMHQGRRESRPGEQVAGFAMALLSPLLLGSLKKYRPIHPARVAENLAQLIEEGFSGRLMLESAELERRARKLASTERS